MKNPAKTEELIEKIRTLREKTGISRTILAVCPNSKAVIRAAIRSAKRNRAPVKFAATLNQVDQDGGYTGMNHRQFVEAIRKEALRYNFTGPVIIAIDHGGPWLRDHHRTEKWNLHRTMSWVKNSFELAIEAGYDLIHVDPTVDLELPAGKGIAIETVAQRTVELISHCESYRRSRELPPISYEVGTEEVHGGLADLSTFKRFFELLKRGLEESDFPDIWPCFVVGKVGTDLHTTQFDPETAKKIVEIAGSYGSLIKGHYSDNVQNPEAYPAAGMGAANVGPEFTEREYDALAELDSLEQELVREGRIPFHSAMKKSLWNAVIQSGRWQKWISDGEDPDDFYSISPDRQLWLIKTGCRYIWENPDVKRARKNLNKNLADHGIEAEEVVLAHVENAMDKYYNSFNLVNLTQLI